MIIRASFDTRRQNVGHHNTVNDKEHEQSDHVFFENSTHESLLKGHPASNRRGANNCTREQREYEGAFWKPLKCLGLISPPSYAGIEDSMHDLGACSFITTALCAVNDAP